MKSPWFFERMMMKWIMMTKWVLWRKVVQSSVKSETDGQRVRMLIRRAPSTRITLTRIKMSCKNRVRVVSRSITNKVEKPLRTKTKISLVLKLVDKAKILVPPTQVKLEIPVVLLLHWKKPQQAVKLWQRRTQRRTREMFYHHRKNL